MTLCQSELITARPVGLRNHCLEQCRTFAGVPGLPKLHPRALWSFILEVIKNPRKTSKSLEPLLTQVIVFVYNLGQSWQK